MFLRCSLVIKKGVNSIEAIKSLKKTKVIGPTSGADTLINKNDDPQAMPIAMIKDQSITEFLFIYD
jgi:hypothetical protein